MLKPKKNILLILALLFCLVISIINVNAVYETPTVAAQVATASTEPPTTVRYAEVEEVDNEQNVYLENQPFDDTTNTAIVICAVEGGIISILLLIIIVLMVKNTVKKNRV
jgi:hypothetical protein